MYNLDCSTECYIQVVEVNFNGVFSKGGEGSCVFV
jgi:hypothetical protein